MPNNRRSIPARDEPPRRRRPATTPEARESEMVSLAEKLAERQLRDGSASAQVITHYLKLGSTRERLEQKRLEGEIEVQVAKIKAMGSSERLEALYSEAMAAFRGYQGRPSEDAEDEYEGD